MDANEKLLKVSKSNQSFEEFYHELFDPFVKRGVWEFDGRYDVFIESLGHRYQSELEGEKINWQEEFSGRELDHVDKNPAIFSHGNARLRLERKESGDDILSGFLEYRPEDIENMKEAEPSSFLSELRNTYQQIVKYHQTDYIRPRETRTSNLETPKESILSVTIPADYDSEIYRETANAITSIAVDIENLHRSMEALVSGYAEDH